MVKDRRSLRARSLDSRARGCLALTVTRISVFLSELLPWVLIAVLAFNMSQRRSSGRGDGKRYATLWVAGLLGASWVATIVFKRFGVPDGALLGVAAVLALVAWMRRHAILVFRVRCAVCGKRLPLVRILYHDDPRCAGCAGSEEPTPAP